MASKTRKPKQFYIVSIILLVLFIILGILFFPYLKAEYLTKKYGKEFEHGYEQTRMIESIKYFKVIEYSDSESKVVYISEESVNIVIFKREDDQWNLKSWNTVYSWSGSADEFMWPYYR